MVKFENSSKYKHIKEIKNILNSDDGKYFLSCIKQNNFEELYNSLMVSDITPKVMGEFTKFIYNALEINPLDILTEVPDFFLTYTDLIEIKIPDHITVINDYAFAFLNNLEKVTLPSNLEILGTSCFVSNPKLEEITIPKTLKEIKNGIFLNCPFLHIYYQGTLKEFLKIKNNKLFAAKYRKVQCIDAELTFSYTKNEWLDLDDDIYIS